MQNLKEINLALFLTRGMSLSKWEEIGSLYREIKPYQKLAEHFTQIYLFTYGGVSDQKYSNLFPDNVQIVTKPEFLSAILYSFLLPFVHRRKLKEINIIKTNQMDGAWTAVLAKKLSSSKLVIRCGYEWLQTIEKAGGFFLKKRVAYWVERYAYRNADSIILTSTESRDFVIKRFKVNMEKIRLIPNFVDTDLFMPLPLEKEKNRIIFVGRLEKEKNLDNLFRGLKGLEVKLVVVGSGSLRSKLEALAREHNLDIEFKGSLPQSALPAELNRSELFILSSQYEGNPKVLLEAMSCGLACIGTDIPAIRSIITDQMDGILSLPESFSLRAAITGLLENKELRAKLGANARIRMEEENSFPVFLERELSVYRSLSQKNEKGL